MIRFNDITKRYADNLALKNLNLTIESGELFVLVGPSGSGKTTLLKMINRLNDPSQGTVEIDGVDIRQMDIQKSRQNIGYVLQDSALFPNMTVAQNAAIQLEAQGWDLDKRTARVSELMKLVGLNPDICLHKMPSELSGGEAQRIGIVRALCSSPDIVLMDEPFSALDPISKRQLQDLVLKLHKELGTTFVFVTHDMQEAIKIADRMAIIHNGQLQQVGTTREILANPENEFVKKFFEDDHEQAHFLGSVLAKGFGEVYTVDAEVMQTTDTIFQWADRIKLDSEKLINVEGHILTSEDLVVYLASLKEVE
ncbi:ABC transporter ATP-binding protein [Lactobacillus sp. YT155]|uniref:ABC transporter ATP-binding protein n=1 Tax=Lactobacillus sp. YT155 TaxID=3060955 RepID=UPI00265F6D13|nr:ABC transporter ATP-binding protein [Lactobacillus sp. YT155]MDO1604503.1 ABC transporter ATP-binding protein [Lactobacillus sp. YT155]